VSRDVRILISSTLGLILVLTSWTTPPRFLLAALQIDSLRRCLTIRKLREAVELLPSGLTALYESTWARIVAQTEDEVSLATKALLWLTYAYEPLTITRLQHAVVLSDEADRFDDDIVPEELILAACCGLIEVDKQSEIVRLVRAYIFYRSKTTDG
jgi:hypothetical protein